GLGEGARDGSEDGTNRGARAVPGPPGVRARVEARAGCLIDGRMSRVDPQRIHGPAVGTTCQPGSWLRTCTAGQQEHDGARNEHVAHATSIPPEAGEVTRDERRPPPEGPPRPA